MRKDGEEKKKVEAKKQLLVRKRLHIFVSNKSTVIHEVWLPQQQKILSCNLVVI